MTSKSRITGPGKVRIGTLTQLSFGVQQSQFFYQAEFQGFESLLSEGHPYHSKWLRKKGFDLGGIFGHQKREYKSYPQSVTSKGGTIASEYRYEGDIHAYATTRLYGASDVPDLTPQNVIEGYGSTGYNRAKPTASGGGVGQFIGELREVPTLPKFLALKNAAKAFYRLNPGQIYVKGVAKEVAGNYLNYEFGWKPFLKDIRDFFKNVVNTDAKLKQLARDNMRWVHRNATILDQTSFNQSFINSQVGNPVLPTPLILQTGRLAVNTNVFHKIWFSGSFRYYIPTGNSPMEVAQRKRQLLRIVYGAEVSPKLVWQLMRYTWLADWVANIGDNISNLSENAADSLVAHYAYAMDERITETEYQLIGCSIRGVGPISPRAVDTSLVQGRARASPYGFALKPGNFSARQVAILAALGITRS